MIASYAYAPGVLIALWMRLIEVYRDVGLNSIYDYLVNNAPATAAEIEEDEQARQRQEVWLSAVLTKLANSSYITISVTSEPEDALFDMKALTERYTIATNDDRRVAYGRYSYTVTKPGYKTASYHDLDLFQMNEGTIACMLVQNDDDTREALPCKWDRREC